MRQAQVCPIRAALSTMANKSQWKVWSLVRFELAPPAWVNLAAENRQSTISCHTPPTPSSPLGWGQNGPEQLTPQLEW